jgi:hypothetical protein
MLQSWFRVQLPVERGRVVGLQPAALRSQVHYAAAVARAWRGGGAGGQLTALQADLAALRQGAQSGLFSD